jgi:DNA replication protein DnaC
MRASPRGRPTGRAGGLDRRDLAVGTRDPVERGRAERRLKAAKLPTPKAPDTFDLTAAPSVNRPLIVDLMRCEYLERRENVILVGASGSGKSHLAPAAAACGLGRRVRSFRVTELATLLREAREERQLTRSRSQPANLDQLVPDELGYVPASRVGAELLFDVIGRAYERSSVIVTTNLPLTPSCRSQRQDHASISGV